VPVLVGVVGLAVGYALASMAPGITSFTWIHGVVIAMLGAAATFSPLVADTALWFERRRGIAVAICASGNYVAGAIWPPVIQALVAAYGWRQTYVGRDAGAGVDAAAARDVAARGAGAR
jgi:MFS family permease